MQTDTSPRLHAPAIPAAAPVPPTPVPAPVPPARPGAVETGRSRFLADLLERMVWTFVAAFLSALVSPPLAEAAGLQLSLGALDAALVAGVSAVVNLVTIVARVRLSVLPDPGAGLVRRAS